MVMIVTFVPKFAAASTNAIQRRRASGSGGVAPPPADRGMPATVAPIVGLSRIAQLDVSAASGLVVDRDALAVIADDELHLVRYGRDGSRRESVRLFGGSLPEEPRARKRAKPDLEALTLLPDGRLFALGSGSTDARDRGAVIAGRSVQQVALAPLYDALRSRFDRLNLEGAATLGHHLVLLSRRTGARGRNALVRLELGGVLAALDRPQPVLEPGLLVDIVDVDLGAVDGTPLGFTDATPISGGLLFAAAAEVTDDPVDDGATMGCILGFIAADLRLRSTWRVQPCAKIEGIAVDDGRLLAVADADDRDAPAPLFAAPLPHPLV